jgi:hypothetical protein
MRMPVQILDHIKTELTAKSWAIEDVNYLNRNFKKTAHYFVCIYYFSPLNYQDYDRDPEILRHLSPCKVMALCSELQIIPCRGNGDDDFKKLLKELVEVKFLGANQN